MSIPSNMCKHCGGEVKLFEGKDLRWACTGSCGRVANIIHAMELAPVAHHEPERDVDWDRITTDTSTIAAVFASTM